MNVTAVRQLVTTYMEGWVEGNREKILSTLDPACVIIESYGPTYRGKEVVAEWIDTWLGAGNRVDRWELTSFFMTDEMCIFEWNFACTFEGKYAEFEGISLARLKNENLVFLREYAMTGKRYEWKVSLKRE